MKRELTYKHLAGEILEDDDRGFISLREKEVIAENTKNIEELRNMDMVTGDVFYPAVDETKGGYFWVEGE